MFWKMVSFNHDDVYVFQSPYRFTEIGNKIVQNSVSLPAVSRPIGLHSSEAKTSYGRMKPRVL